MPPNENIDGYEEKNHDPLPDGFMEDLGQRLLLMGAFMYLSEEIQEIFMRADKATSETDPKELCAMRDKLAGEQFAHRGYPQVEELISIVLEKLDELLRGQTEE